MTQLKHRFPVRIYYEDTDAGGIVYHANYFRFMERARTECLREAGIDHAKIAREQHQHFVVGELSARYKAPAVLDDELIVETSVLTFGGASIKLRQNILKRVASTESLLLEGTITLVYISTAGRSVRVPQTIRDALVPYSSPKESSP